MTCCASLMIGLSLVAQCLPSSMQSDWCCLLKHLHWLIGGCFSSKLATRWHGLHMHAAWQLPWHRSSTHYWPTELTQQSSTGAAGWQLAGQCLLLLSSRPVVCACYNTFAEPG